MKMAQQVFLYVALISAICAVWIPGFRWQYIITMGVLLIAAAGIEASKMQSAKDEEEVKK